MVFELRYSGCNYYLMVRISADCLVSGWLINHSEIEIRYASTTGNYIFWPFSKCSTCQAKYLSSFSITKNTTLSFRVCIILASTSHSAFRSNTVKIRQISTSTYLVEERVNSEIKTFDRQDYCPHIQTITLYFSKVLLLSLAVFPSLKFAHPRTRIRTSGPASHHPRTCIKQWDLNLP